MDRPKSPSGSVSSILSSESRNKLIPDSLKPNLFFKHPNVVTPVLPQATPNGGVLPKAAENKKPVKFTVRKVSREENNSFPFRMPSGASTKTRQYAYGNLPENKKILTERNSGNTLLQRNQEKYDLYVKRLDKIDKEIEFLLNLLPPYNVEIDYSTRTKIMRAIEKLRVKRDEVDKKKYTLGMSISRMWREFDENETWVRSVSKH